MLVLSSPRTADARARARQSLQQTRLYPSGRCGARTHPAYESPAYRLEQGRQRSSAMWKNCTKPRPNRPARQPAARIRRSARTDRASPGRARKRRQRHVVRHTTASLSPPWPSAMHLSATRSFGVINLADLGKTFLIRRVFRLVHGFYHPITILCGFVLSCVRVP